MFMLPLLSVLICSPTAPSFLVLPLCNPTSILTFSMRSHLGLLLAIFATYTSVSCVTTSTSTTTLQPSTIRVGAGTEPDPTSSAQNSPSPAQSSTAANSAINPNTTTNDLLSNSSSIAPLSQLNGVQAFVSNTLANQTNITAYKAQFKARLSGYFADYVATHGYGQPPNSTQNITEVLDYRNGSCDTLKQTHKRTVTDIYFLQVLLNQTSKHIHRVREVMVSGSCVVKAVA